MSENAQRWLYIAFGFVGAIFTIAISLLDFYNTRKTKTVKTTLIIQCVVLLINLTMFIYGFGLSMINIDKPIFYNSMPTWVGNGIAFIINGIVTFLIYRYRPKKHTRT